MQARLDDNGDDGADLQSPATACWEELAAEGMK